MSYTALTVLGFSLYFYPRRSARRWCFSSKRNFRKAEHAFWVCCGIMIAASVWSLLIPSIEAASDWGTWSFVPARDGFVAGGLFLVLLDKIVPHFHSGTNEDEGPQTSLNKPVKMFLAVTIHNIPEGLAVGFAFGSGRRAWHGRCVCFGARACARHCDTEFSRGRGGVPSVEAGDGKQGQGVCLRRRQRSG